MPQHAREFVGTLDIVGLHCQDFFQELVRLLVIARRRFRLPGQMQEIATPAEQAGQESLSQGITD